MMLLSTKIMEGMVMKKIFTFCRIHASGLEWLW